jgi:hypothetical protein
MSMSKTLQMINQMMSDGIISKYAIAGAVAALNYIEPTVTEDLDILISFETQPNSPLVTLGPVVAYLASKGYSEWRKEGLLIEGWPVQFLPVADALDQEALDLAETIHDSFGDSVIVPTRILSAEHVVATALRTARPKDHLRICAFLEENAVDFDRLRDIIDRHGLDGAWMSFCQKTGLTDPLAGKSQR